MEMFYSQDVPGGMDEMNHDQALLSFYTEIAGTECEIEKLTDLVEKVTETNLDLSCAWRISKYTAQEIVLCLGHEIGINPDQTDIINFKAAELKDYVQQITKACRQQALESLVGIGSFYSKAATIAATLGPLRQNPPEIVNAILSGEIIEIRHPHAISRSLSEEQLCRTRTLTNEQWVMLFTLRDHRDLAKRYLTGDLTLDGLAYAFRNMPEPQFTDKNDRH
jgi:hypothetical protein